MEPNEILALLVPLNTDMGGDVHELVRERYHLAHYCTMDTAEKILRSREVWWSNPLFANDYEELRRGIREGRDVIQAHTGLQQWLGTRERYVECIGRYLGGMLEFEDRSRIEVFVFCLSRHDPRNTDGLLSMWRGYGGLGMGAALVFQTDFIRARPESPILVLKVEYWTADRRTAWFTHHLDHLCRLLQGVAIPDDKLWVVSKALFDMNRVFALKFKHPGFVEEQEWRFIYTTDRDPGHLLTDKVSYKVGPQGIEPCLKLPFTALARANSAEWRLEDILHQFILGPRNPQGLAKQAVEVMLKSLNLDLLIPRVVTSTIPFRIHSG